MAKIKNETPYLLFSSTLINLKLFFLYYVCNNFFNKNIFYLDSFINFIPQKFFRFEFISGYKSFGTLFFGSFSIFLLSGLLEVAINAFHPKNAGKETNNLKSIIETIIKVCIVTLIGSAIFYPNSMQDFLNSSLTTYCLIFCQALLFVATIFKTVDTTLELGYVEPLEQYITSKINGVKSIVYDACFQKA